MIKPTRQHKHDGSYELVLLTRGAGYHTIDDSLYEVRPPLFHILKPGQVHCWDFSQIPTGFVLMVREDFMGTAPGIREKLYDLPVEIHLQEVDAYLALYEQCYREYQEQPEQTDTLEAYLNLIIIKLHHQIRAQPVIDFPAKHTFYQFKKLVDQHFRQY